MGHSSKRISVSPFKAANPCSFFTPERIRSLINLKSFPRARSVEGRPFSARECSRDSAMALIQWWTTVSSSEQAAWVQAVGSVAAICVAVAIPAFTSLSQKRMRAAESVEKAKNVILSIYPSLLKMSRSLDRFIETSDRYEPPWSKYLYRSEDLQLNI